jgi:hypothetical protein
MWILGGTGLTQFGGSTMYPIP